ncbi:GntR family transcriptional regulator (plasmid) [Prescottella equi]|nr:GntR family transcriptional regulator [Prescottella equi]WQB72140.1 GntR family transcriptional regulator [Prescottella equi]
MSMLPKYAAMREYLLDEIHSGRYRTGDQLPTLDDLNRKFGAIGEATGTRAYSELVKLGMVEHRYGVGHFLRSTTPPESARERHRIPPWVHLDSIESALRSAFAATQALREDTRMVLHVVEFQEKRTGGRFGKSLHVSRPAAEKFGVDILTRLGEDPDTAADMANRAGVDVCEGATYGVQISTRLVGGVSRDIANDSP